MRLLLDFHHHDLWESMELLCERLGWTLYRPIGMDWWDQGYHNHERDYRTAHGIYPIDAVARQYLEPWGSDSEAYWSSGALVAPGQRLDQSHGRMQNLLTLSEARDLRPDIVISSLAHNHEGFHRFAREVGAKFGLQIGNVRFSEIDMQEDRWDLAAFGLVSARMPAPIPVPHVVYHQEFRGFDPAPPVREGPLRVSSFVQCYPQDTRTYPYFLGAAERAPELDWRVYGSYGTAAIDQYAAGNLDKCADVAHEMRLSDVAWHAKAWSDGYGHVIHNWFSIGRPVLGFHSYYKNQLAGDLWIEGVTAWDIEGPSPDETVALLRRFRDDEDFHLRACEAAAKRFREVVNFDEEEQAIRDLFSRVL